MRKAVLTFELGAPRNRAVLAALGPEASRDVPRASANISSDGPVLKLEISAEDSASLRAAVNSYLRWVKLAAGAAQAGSDARKAGVPESRGAGKPKNRGTGRPAARRVGKNASVARKK